MPRAAYSSVERLRGAPRLDSHGARTQALRRLLTVCVPGASAVLELVLAAVP